ncbi:zinc finger protein 271-like [Leguminivora glycinivorella]|uniref:zinc finger protein 271-like n=1 Tax=Leguminivora glycinivorella TaxID=1035111 RepID=UPI00200C5FB2|nr:zinc finger protein 271-like [Leguminivora glycinivorella]
MKMCESDKRPGTFPSEQWWQHGIEGWMKAHVKEEPCDQVSDHALNKGEAEVTNEENQVKTELLNNECKSSAVDVLAELYKDHTVKGEVVLGPEHPHRPDVMLVVHGRVSPEADCCPNSSPLDFPHPEYALPDCYVRLERLRNHEALSTNHGSAQNTNTGIDEEIYVKEYEGKDLTCEKCGKSFTQKSNLKRHVKIHIQKSNMKKAKHCAEKGVKKQKTILTSNQSHILRQCFVKIERLSHHTLIRFKKRPNALNRSTVYSHRGEKQSDLSLKMKTQLTSRELHLQECFVSIQRLPQHMLKIRPTMFLKQSNAVGHTREKLSCKITKLTSSKLHTLRHCFVKTQRLPHHAKKMRSVLNQSHVESHTGETPPKSTSKKFKKLKTNTHKNNEKKRMIDTKYVCDTCHRIFSRKEDLIQHVKLHLRNNLESNVNSSIIDEKTRDVEQFGMTNQYEQKSMEVNTSSVSKTQPAFVSSSTTKEVDKKSYSCKICNGQFEKLSHFKIHRRLHLGLNVFTCEVCDKMFDNLNCFESHKRIHTGEKPYSCNICKKSYAQVSHLNSHKRVHTGDKPFACEICKKRFVYSNVLTIHMRIWHTDIKPYTCNICNKQFKTQSQYKSHERVHTGERPYSCEICDKRYKLKQALNVHVLLHTGRKPYYCDVCDKYFALQKYYRDHKCRAKKPYSCEVCLKKFKSPSSLSNHQIMHTRNKPYSCELCDERFLYKSQYNRHYLNLHTDGTYYSCKVCYKMFEQSKFEEHKLIHTGKKCYSCELCDQKFSRRKDLSLHKQTHTDTEFTCDICKRELPNKSKLTKHIRAHMGDKPFVCEICKKRYSHLNQLNKHKSKHMKHKTYTCKICKEEFTRLYRYQIHRRNHLGEFVYSCEVCEEKFVSKSHFETHKRRHTGERPFSCDICDKKFAENSYLTVHMRIHTGEKPYKCDICDKRFAQCGDWNKHKRIHSGIKPFSCETCKKRFADLRSLRCHTYIHTGERPYSCEQCKRSYSHKTSLQAHLRTHDP